MAVYDDDAVPYREVRRSDPNPFSWVVPLLLVVVAFFAGWWANAYTTNNNSGSGLVPGVGGGPSNTRSVSPAPTSGVTSPSVSPMVTAAPSPTVMPTSPTPTPIY